MALFLAALQLLYVIGVHWTMTSVVRFGADALAQARPPGTFVPTWLALVGGATTIAALVALVMPGALRALVAPSGGGGRLAAAFLVAVVLARASEHLLQCFAAFPASAAARVAGKMGVAAILLALTAASISAPAGVLAAMGTGFLVQALASLPALDAPAWGRPVFDRGLFTAMGAFSLPLLLRSAAGYGTDWVDVLVLRLWDSAAEIGTYHAAYVCMNVLVELLGALATVGLPLASALRSEGRSDLTLWYANRLAPRLAAAWAAIVLLIGLVAPPIAELTLGPRFAATGPLLTMLMTAAALQFAVYVAWPLLAAHDRTVAATGAVVAGLVVNAAADLLLVPQMGAFGAALGTVLGVLTSAVLHWWRAAGLGGAGWAVMAPAALVAPALLLRALAQPIPWVAAAATAGLLGLVAITALRWSEDDQSRLRSIR